MVSHFSLTRTSVNLQLAGQDHGCEGRLVSEYPNVVRHPELTAAVQLPQIGVIARMALLRA
jgi:hypothetical protein